MDGLHPSTVGDISAEKHHLLIVLHRERWEGRGGEKGREAEEQVK